MNNNISFFTPISYANNEKSNKRRFFETVDDFFFFSGRKAVIVKSGKNHEKFLMKDENAHFLKYIVVALSVATLFIPVVMLALKIGIRLHNNNFKPFNTQKALENKLEIEDGIIVQITNIMANRLQGREAKNFELVTKNINEVFKLTNKPNLIFKTCYSADGKPENKRFANMIRAKETCLAENLDLMIIPRTKLLEITVPNQARKITLIVEEMLNIEKAQFEDPAQNLTETIRQLTRLICKTGLNDVKPANIPFMNEAQDYKGPRRIGLIDLEMMDNAHSGLYGGMFGGYNAGLRKNVPQSLIPVIDKELKNHVIQRPRFNF